MAQHTFSSLCHGIQTLSTTGPIGPPHWLLLVGLPLVSPRKGTHSALPGHPLLLCLGWVCRWCLWPFQERVEPKGEPSWCKTKNTKPHNAYDVVKYARDFKKGNTIMKNYGDLESQMCHIGGFLSEVYDDTRLVNFAIGEPKPGNLAQIHDKVMKKLECMAHARWRDTHISEYPIPFCCKPATLCKMYTLEELQMAGIVTTMTTSADPVTSGWPTCSEFEESNITDTEGLHEVIEESTDTEMVRQTHTTLMIISDREKVRLKALVKEQDCAINEAVRKVQEWHLEEVHAIVDAVRCQEDGWSSHKCHSASQEEDIKRSREESPEYGAMPQERGRSLHCKSKSDLQYPTLPGRRCPGSQSFTPSRHHSHSRSSMPGQSHCRNSTPHTSRKQPVAKPPRLTEATPTQSLAQKTPKLKILVQRVPAMKNYLDPLYNSLDKDPKEFIRYLMGNLDWKAYNAEIRCLAAFYSQATVLAHHVITSTITTLVAANRSVHFLVPFIPRELVNLPSNRLDAEPSWAPACSEDYQTDIRVHCVWEWMYLMHLLQYWYDAGSVYTYGGPIRQENKLMLYIFYRINAMLNPYGIFIRLHEVMDNTPWLSYYQAHTWPEQHIADYESHLHVIKGLEVLWNWLRNYYLVEATVEWRHLKLYGGSLDRLPFLCSYEDQQPGNEGLFYHSRGIHPNEVEPTLENAPLVANAMLEALAHHNHRQSEAQDCQEYQQ